MNYKHFLSYVLAILFLTTSCSGLVSKSKSMIQFEIEEEITVTEKANAIQSVKKRLISLGADDVKVVSQEGKKITVNYLGTIDSVLIKENFSIVGNLEFYQVCDEKAIIYEYLRSLDESEETDNQKDRSTSFTDIIKDTAPTQENDVILGFIYKVDVKRIAPLLEKAPVYIPKLKKKVKFLLGKSTRKSEALVYAVYVTASDKAPLNGRYVTYAVSEEGYIEGTYEINIGMSPEGAYIWERLTEKVYLDRGFIAIVLDDLVHVSPAVTSGKITGGHTQIAGSFTKENAEMLASVIKSGTIPKMKILKMGIVE